MYENIKGKYGISNLYKTSQENQILTPKGA